ncbi:MAG: CHAT domain-containing protein [Chloroflexales bacterium]|nr:CHAT domain-containing protein [Chloroflexales bacterium]
MSDDERAHLDRLLKIYQRNLDRLEFRAANAGGYDNASTEVQNQIDLAKEQVAEVKGRIAALGGASTPAGGSASPPPATAGGGSTGIGIVGSPGASVNNGGTVAGRDIVNPQSGQGAPQSSAQQPGVTPQPPADDTQRVFMEFDISSGTPSITLRSSIIGARRIAFAPPYNDATLPVVIRALDAAQGSAQDFSGDELALLEAHGLVVDGGLAPELHKRVGGAIYQALTAEGKGALEAVRNYSIDQNKPVSYVLRFPRESVNLAALPWEAMWDGDQAVLLARGDDVDSVERYMDIERALPQPVAPGQRLRILALSPQSRISPELRQTERAARLATWDKLKDAGVVTYDEISPLTVRALSDYMRNNPPPDIIHYYGHGIYENGQGYLEFDDGMSGAARISAQRLSAMLGSVRLIVLHACQTAMVTQRGGLLTGVAPALSIVTGAVVAMQLSVRIDAATRFSEVFYDELLRKRRSLQQAVAEGRQTLYFEEADGASWYVPTLYIRGREQKPVYLVQ